jgi:acetyl esterase/lipase
VSRLAPLIAAVALAAAPSGAVGEGEGTSEPGSPGSPPARELVASHLDLPYADTGNPRHRLDLYLPTQPKREKLPVVVFVHGGGWQDGDKAVGAALLLPFVRTGEYAGVSVGYRLSDEATWPAQIHDCKAALRFVRVNAARYGLDPDRIGAFGQSAGGHLALMLGLTGGVPVLEGELGAHGGTSSRVAAVANFFGPTELLAMVGQPGDIDRAQADAPEAKLIGGPLRENPEKAAAASPVTYVTPDDPPVLTVHGTADRTVPYDQGVRIDAALRKAGVTSYLVTVEGGGHGDFGTAADDRVRALFDRYLRGEPAEVSAAPVAWPARRASGDAAP